MEAELIEKPKNELVEIVNASGLEKTKADFILTHFQDYFKIASEWEVKSKTIKVTDASQTTEMGMAKVARKMLSQKRIDIENARKELKEQSLREGKAIDGIANVLRALIVPIEQYLKTQEDFVEIQAAKKAEEDRIEAERKAEEDRIAKEKAEAEERERMRLENERLKKEAEAKEKALEAERRKVAEEKAEAERKAKAEQDRLKKEAVEMEAKHKAELEEKKNQELIAQKANAKEWASKFEDYLYEYYSEVVNPTCLDDMLPDCTSDWLGGLDVDEVIKLAGMFIANKIGDLK